MVATWNARDVSGAYTAVLVTGCKQRGEFKVTWSDVVCEVVATGGFQLFITVTGSSSACASEKRRIA